MTNDPNQVPPPPYGGPPAGYGQTPGYYGGPPGTYAGMQAFQPEHPQGTTILVVGILSFVVCQLLGPVAWYMGSKARADVQASPTGYSNSSLITVGWVLGIVSTGLMIVSVVLVAVYIIFVLFVFAASGTA